MVEIPLSKMGTMKSINWIKWLFAAIVVLASVTGNAQTSSFGVYMEPVSISGLPGIHSFAHGEHNGKWLIVGGRKDGLHRRQPTSSFDVAGNNTNLVVIDPVGGQQWSAPLASLPVALQEQLSSTNMEYYQKDTTLYCVGGYGYSATAANHITFQNIVAINVAGVINAVINGLPITSYFRYQADTMFAVTGGHLKMIYDTYYLVGGNKFTGRYNPMGGASYTQAYTNQIRKFRISDDGSVLSVTHLPSYTDATNLHRRDYNAVPQIMPDGKEGITAFSGVFKPTADIPFLDCVTMDSAGYAVNAAFSQYYNHYHCANIPVYSAAANEMHTVFFGGIAQYYDSAGVLTMDNNVPFVKTVARVTRDNAGTMTEYKLPVDMPGLLGAGAEFMMAEGVPEYANHVIKYDALTSDTTMVGYIYGGIKSTGANIFFTNTGTQSSAYDQLLKLYIVKGSSVGVDKMNQQSVSTLKMQVYPNPNDGNIYANFYMPQAGEVMLSVSSGDGKLIEHKKLGIMSVGENHITYKLPNNAPTGSYIVTIATAEGTSTQKIVLSR